MTLHLSHHARTEPGARSERGAILVFMALSMIAVLMVATIVIDGSQAYSQRRSMQNAADLSALAGARALDKVKYAGASWSSVNAAATNLGGDNKAEAIDCTVITNVGAPIGGCEHWWAVHWPGAAGVRVEATDIRNTTFAKVTGVDTVTARATSAATIQTLIGTGSPFVVCGNAELGGYPILNSDNTINIATATAMGTVEVQSSQVPTCGAGSAFKGKIADEDFTVPGWLHADNGNGYEQDINVQVVGAKACPSGGPFDDCDMLIPIADRGHGNGTDIQMHAVAWAVFHITGTGQANPKYYATFRSAAPYVTGGRTSVELPANSATPRVIRIIQ
ncbi:pilus assembly protein TadG-related protein [Aquihabitans daechungensis]|uniref:pilus assembly protein TadG-related protein n=1 Tax=Aquihabitans daechungensis TaxID=1052257 RepID=UPI003BA290ED